MKIYKLTSLRPSLKWAGERPSRRNLLARCVAPKGRVFLVVLVALVFAAAARTATQPDPIVALLGSPSKPDGAHIYYAHKRFGHTYICRIWAYGSQTNIRSYVEQCVTAPAKKKGPKS